MTDTNSAQNKSLFGVYFTPRMLLILLFGFSSGLPLLLIGGTLQAWLTDAQLDIVAIGKFALVGLPYTLKFLWAPFIDTIKLPFLTQRRAWGVLIQLALVGSLVLLAMSDPATNLAQFALLSFVVAFFSASQDIVIDAVRIDILPKEELGAGGSVNTIGYRIAMVMSGSVALVWADQMGWKSAYLLMALIQCVGLFAFLIVREPVKAEVKYVNFKERVTVPFIDFLSRRSAVEILLFIMVYKLPTLMATALTTKFLKDMSFSNTDIGVIAKSYGMLASILGAFIGGALIVRLGYKKSLWFFGIIQALAGLTFIVLSEQWYGFHFSPEFANSVFPEHWMLLKRSLSDPRLFAMLWVLVADNFMMGLGVSSLVGFMQSVCNRQFGASQYALLTSVMAVPRVILVSQAGVFAGFFGYTKYFIFTMLLAVPGLLMLLKYDQWMKSFEADARPKMEKSDFSVLGVLLVGLLCITLDPVFAFFDLKSVGTNVGWVGVAMVIVAMVMGYIKPKAV